MSFEGWDDEDVVDQFWYLTERLQYAVDHGHSVDIRNLTRERHEIVREALERGIVEGRRPFPGRERR